MDATKRCGYTVGCYGGSGYNSAQYIQQTADGGYIVSGSRSGSGIVTSAAFLLKIDSLGNIIWGKVYNADGELGFSVLETSMGGFLIAGGSGLFTSNQQAALLMMTDSLGNPIIAKTYTTEVPCGFNRVQPTPDGGYFAIGQRAFSETGDFYDGLYLVKLDSLLQVEWSKAYADSYIVGVIPVIQPTNDGNYILGAEILSPNQSGDILTIKIDGLGQMIWSRTIGRAGGDHINYIQQTEDLGYVILGTTTDTANEPAYGYFIKADSLGNSCFASIAEPAVVDVTTTVAAISFTITALDSSQVINLTVGSGATGNILCMDTMSTVISDVSLENWFTVFPNPANDRICMKATSAPYNIAIINMLGEKVFSATVQDRTATLDLSDKPKGLYAYIVQQRSKRIHGKLLLR